MIRLNKNIIFIIILYFLSGYSASYSQTTTKTRVRSIDLEGYKYFTEQDLLVTMGTKKDGYFNKMQYDLDLLTIRNRYKSSGFLFMKFKGDSLYFASDSSSVEIFINISEGDKVNIGKINLTGNKIFSDEEILKSLNTKDSEILDENVLNNDIKALLEKYSAKGLPFASVTVEDISMYKDNGKDKIELSLNIKENSRVEISQVKIKGNEDTKDFVILRELKLSKEKIINSTDLDEIKKRLERLNIFQRVEDPKIYSLKNKNESGLLIEVTEGNVNTFDGVLGYVPPVSDADKGYFTGLVNISFRNLFGTGRKIEAKYESLVRTTQELEFKYYEPYIFGLPVFANMGFLQRIQDSTYSRRAFDLRGEVYFSQKFSLAGIAGYDRVIPSDSVSNVLKVADSRLFYTGIEVKFDNRDNIFIPTKGAIFLSNYTYGNKKIFNILELAALGYQENFSVQKYSAEADLFFSFFKRQTLLLKGFAGEVRSDRLEDADLFRIGGTKYVRGYRNEQFLASKLGGGNTELRYSIGTKSFLFGFYDFGYYFRPEDVLNHINEEKGFLFGYGLGIRLETQLGVIGVSYALGKGDGISDGKINFGLINNF
ncbi:BamA/TamA family outer membrane protein [soil metagenome]